MFVGIARYDLRLPGCSSLKEKRSVLRGLQSLLQQKFRCAIAEVAHQDLWQRATIGTAVVSGTSFQARKVLAEIERHVDTYPGIELLGSTVDVVSSEDE
jgi:uncharacterized protein YlxP (DUF503 family)